MSTLYTGKLQFIFSVPQLSIFDPELLFEKQKSTPKDGLISGSIIFVVGKSPMDIMEPILL